jgi:WD40 repeat protein
MKNVSKYIVALLVFAFVITACASATTNEEIVTVENTPTLTASPTVPPTATFTPTAPPTPAPTNHPGWIPEGAIARFGMGTYNAMAISPDNSIVVVAGTGGVHFIDPLAGVTTNFLETGANAEDVAFSPDGKQIYIGLGIQGVAVWVRDEINSWKQEEILPVPCAAQVKISPNNDILFTKCWENAKNSKFIAWDIASKTQRYQTNYAQPKTSFAMAFSLANPDLMAVAANYTVTLMEVKGGRTISIYYEPNKNKVVDLDFSTDGSQLAITSESSEVILLNVESGEESGRIQHSSNVSQLSFIDADTVVAFMEKYFIVENLDGKTLKKFDFSLNRAYVYIPQHHLIAMGDGGSVITVSLDTEKITGKVEGFNLYSLYTDTVSGNGNVVLKSNAIIHTDNPADLMWVDAYKVCSDPKFSRFMDNDGKYMLFICGQDKLVTAELSTMKVISSYKYPSTYTSNAFAEGS